MALRLLIVDDRALIREAVCHVAAALEPGTDVLTAADCEAGFDAWRSRVAATCQPHAGGGGIALAILR
jgi:hypothetical protein